MYDFGFQKYATQNADGLKTLRQTMELPCSGLRTLRGFRQLLQVSRWAVSGEDWMKPKSRVLSNKERPRGSRREVMKNLSVFLQGFLCLSVCLHVCLSACTAALGGYAEIRVYQATCLYTSAARAWPAGIHVDARAEHKVLSPNPYHWTEYYPSA
jgi:hypothetical protein